MVKNALKEGKTFEPYSGASGVVSLDGIVWGDLVCSSGADDYVSGGTNTWHIDGEFGTPEAKIGSITCKFFEEGTTNELAPEEKVSGISGNKFDASDVIKQTIGNYSYVGSNLPASGLTFEYGNEQEAIFYYKLGESTYTVNYFDAADPTKKIERSKTETANYGEIIQSANEVAEIEGYLFANASVEQIEIHADHSQNVINLYYDKDANGDEIADKYQVELTYSVINGSIDEDDAVAKGFTIKDGVAKKTVTLTDEHGKHTTAEDGGVYQLEPNDVPVFEQNPHYGNGHFVGDNEAYQEFVVNQIVERVYDSVASDTSYVYEYDLNSYAYTVNYYEEGTTNKLRDSEERTAEYDSILSAGEIPEIEGYVYDSVEVGRGVVTDNPDNNEVNVYYTVDTLVDPGNDSNGEKPGDGIPDKYQAVVTIQSENDDLGVVKAGGGAITRVYTIMKSATDNRTAYITLDRYDKTQLVPAEGYAFAGWESQGVADPSAESEDARSMTIQAGGKYEITALWGKDDNKDSIADIFQATVTFQVVNGTFEGSAGEMTSIQKIVTLKKNGEPAKDGVYVISEADIPVSNPNLGYDAAKSTWSSTAGLSESAPLGVGVKGDVTFTITYELGDYPYSIEHLDESGNKIHEDTDGLTAQYGAVINATEDKAEQISGYVFDHVGLPITVEALDGTGAKRNVVQIYYTQDKFGGTEQNPGDGIADKYQVKVNYVSAKPEQGLVKLAPSDAAYAQVSKICNIPGEKATSGTIKPGAAITEAKTGYVFDGWTIETADGEAVDLNDDYTVNVDTTQAEGEILELTYVANWVEDTNEDGIADKYQVTVVFESGEGGIVEPTVFGVITLSEKNAAGEDVYQTSKTIKIPEPGKKPNPGMAFDYWSLDINNDANDEVNSQFDNPTFGNFTVTGGAVLTFTAHWGEDVLVDPSVGVEEDGQGDGIPDKYQAVLSYVVQNGTIAEGDTDSRVITFKDGDENYVEKGEGVYTLTANDIPSMNASEGYRPGAWVGDPAAEGVTQVAGDKTFTYRFVPDFSDVAYEQQNGAYGVNEVYDGNTYTPVITGIIEGLDTVTYRYGDVVSGELPSFTNATDGLLRVEIKRGTENTQDATTTLVVPIHIAKRSVTYVVGNEAKQQGAVDPAFRGGFDLSKGTLVNADDLGRVEVYRTNGGTETPGIYEGALTARFSAETQNPTMWNNYDVTIENGDFTIIANAPEGEPEPEPTPAVTTPPTDDGDDDTTGGTPAPTPAPATTPAPAAAPAAPAAPAEAPAAPATATIDDDATPMTNLPETGTGATTRATATIEDDAIPETAFDNEDPDCWVHFLMILGVLFTVLYAGAVVANRSNFTRGLKGREEDFAGTTETEPQLEGIPAAGAAFAQK
ncbi:MAG: InlB B-repeat-containing protein [Eggerthellaceae bacterium]|nr:InlB B-repeat-containing protein [Eggerthellaceae bacterium]